jgi:adenine-specific DNA-methyltransferase
MSFRNTSVKLTAVLTKEDKQRHGIFFTPKEARDTMFDILDKHNITPHSVLEPSFGSGEFIEDVYERYPAARVTGVELNTELFHSVHRPNLINSDFLTYTGKHDLIIGNPPYVVTQKTPDTLKCQTGRPNMFVQFLYKSICENLTDDGYLAFVLPTSFFNCVYYEPARKYLFEHTTILAVQPLSGTYIDTFQKTFALVLRNGKRNSDFFVVRNGNVYLTPHYRELQELWVGSKSLADIGYTVKTGDVVWNQVKEHLSDSGTLLIYSSNFNKGVLTIGNVKAPKKQYVQNIAKTPMSGKSILINRGYGNTTYKMTAVIADYASYYAENHVNVIHPTASTVPIETVYASLCDARTQKFLEYFVGNGALSKSELESCLPIWTD